MTDTIDPSTPSKEPQKPDLPEAPEITERNLTADNDNLVLLSLADLKRFYSEWEAKLPSMGDGQRAVMLFLEAFITNIEEDKARQLEEAQAAMEKFNPVTPIGNV